MKVPLIVPEKNSLWKALVEIYLFIYFLLFMWFTLCQFLCNDFLINIITLKFSSFKKSLNKSLVLKIKFTWFRVCSLRMIYFGKKKNYKQRKKIFLCFVFVYILIPYSLNWFSKKSLRDLIQFTFIYHFKK